MSIDPSLHSRGSGGSEKDLKKTIHNAHSPREVYPVNLKGFEKFAPVAPSIESTNRHQAERSLQHSTPFKKLPTPTPTQFYPLYTTANNNSLPITGAHYQHFAGTDYPHTQQFQPPMRHQQSFPFRVTPFEEPPQKPFNRGMDMPISTNSNLQVSFEQSVSTKKNTTDSINTDEFKQSHNGIDEFTDSAHYISRSYDINIPGDSCSTIIKLNVLLFLDEYHDIRMKKAFFETRIEYQKTVSDRNVGVSKEIQKVNAWRVKQVEIINNVCFFRFRLVNHNDQEEKTMELDKNGYEILGSATAKVYCLDSNRLGFYINSYGKRTSKILHDEKLATCPFLITFTNGTKDFLTCICAHLYINKRDSKTLISKSEFDSFLRDYEYLQSIIDVYDKRPKKRKATSTFELFSSDEEQEESLKISRKHPPGGSRAELRLKEGPANMLFMNCVTLTYPYRYIDPGSIDLWEIVLKGEKDQVHCKVLNISRDNLENDLPFSTISIFFEIPMVSDNILVLVVKYDNVEQSSNASFYITKSVTDKN